jgi:hypothetical protein
MLLQPRKSRSEDLRMPDPKMAQPDFGAAQRLATAPAPALYVLNSLLDAAKATSAPAPKQSGTTAIAAYQASGLAQASSGLVARLEVRARLIR